MKEETNLYSRYLSIKLRFFHILFMTAIHFFITLKYNANIVDPTYFWIGI